MKKLLVMWLFALTMIPRLGCAAYYTMGVTDSPAHIPALAADKMGFWREQSIDVRTALLPDTEDLFFTVNYRLSATGRYCVDFFICSAGKLGEEQAAGLAVVPLAEAARGKDGTAYVLGTKQWLAEKEPELVKKVVRGYLKGAEWVRDPANAAALTALLDEKYYFLKYAEDAKPLDQAFAKEKLAGITFAGTELFGEDVKKMIENGKRLSLDKQQAVHDGSKTEADTTVVRQITRTAFDDALAWWRFARENDFRNYGTAGSVLNLKARGKEVSPKTYGVISSDFYNSQPVGTAGGFLNDGYGWASDGVAKYAVTDGSAKIAGDFTVWLRCSNRNTKDTILIEQGKYDGAEGFAVMYHRAEPNPWFSFQLNPSAGQMLKLEGAPLGTFLDVCFSYEAASGTLRGQLRETGTGRLITEGKVQVKPGSYRPANVPLTLGGNAEYDTNLPLHGSIENAALWTRALSADELERLTKGPRKETGEQMSATNWHNVRDYGADGDGKHDDTDAIQSAIDDCVYPLLPRERGARVPPKPGFTYGGVVFLPQGTYRTTRPILLRPSITVLGDAAVRPLIVSEAEAALVWWPGDWDDRPIDFFVRVSQNRNCSGVRLENLRVRGGKYGAHTMGCSANGLRMRNCTLEGSEAGLAVTGFMMFSEIRDCQFHNSLWILPRQGARFNTSIVENIEIGLSGTRSEKWAVRLEGCIQCVRLSEITFEVRGKGIYLDANAAGVTIDISNVWNYDTAGPAEVLRIVNGQGISVRNVMATDLPSSIFIGKNVRNIRLENITAKEIVVEDAKATRPIFSNVPTQKMGDAESMIEDDMGGSKNLPR